MRKDLADTLRTAIKRNGLPLNAIAKAAGVPQSTLAEFMDGADMRLSNASKIAKYLRLELKRRK